MTLPALTLAEGETVVVEREELIYRQICEWMISGGTILTSVFGPSTSDAGRPSYSRSSIVSAQESRDWHNTYAPSRSTGVRALAIDEVLEVELLVIDDSGTPIPDGKLRAPGHCFIDYRDLPKADVKSIRYKLYERAMARGEIPTVETAVDGQLQLND